MHRCVNCGNSFEGNFCGNCGEKFVEKLMHFEEDVPIVEDINDKRNRKKFFILIGIIGLMLLTAIIVININGEKIDKDEAISIAEEALFDYKEFYNYGVVDNWMQLMTQEEFNKNWGMDYYLGRKVLKVYKISEYGYGCLSEELWNEHFGECSCYDNANDGIGYVEYHSNACVNRMLSKRSNNIIFWNSGVVGIVVFEDSDEMYLDKESIVINECNKKMITGTCVMRTLNSDNRFEYDFTIEFDENMNYELTEMEQVN